MKWNKPGNRVIVSSMGCVIVQLSVNREGRHPTDEKIAAVKGVLSPKNVAELRSSLGPLMFDSVNANIPTRDIK